MKMPDRNDSPVTSMPTEADIDRYTDEEYERKREEQLGLDVMTVLNNIKENAK